MKVEMRAFRDGKDTVVGEARLGRDGIVEFTGKAKPNGDWPSVFDLETLELLTPDDGARYLEALPHTFNGTYFRAKLME